MIAAVELRMFGWTGRKIDLFRPSDRLRAIEAASTLDQGDWVGAEAERACVPAAGYSVDVAAA